MLGEASLAESLVGPLRSAGESDECYDRSQFKDIILILLNVMHVSSMHCALTDRPERLNSVPVTPSPIRRPTTSCCTIDPIINTRAPFPEKLVDVLISAQELPQPMEMGPTFRGSP